MKEDLDEVASNLKKLMVDFLGEKCKKLTHFFHFKRVPNHYYHCIDLAINSSIESIEIDQVE